MPNLIPQTARDIHGNEVPLSRYMGNVSLVVNVASKCGYTDTNYRGLQGVHEKYGK
jgi:glutathione peroxidase-family protein